MSRFFSKRYTALTPYTPGEQPQDRRYIKLNTNESPYPPSPAVAQAVQAEAGRLQLYSDPACAELRREAARVFGTDERRIVMTNGSDEALNFAFMAFADEERPLLFPDVTYGFYPVFAQLNRIPYREIPLTADFRIDVTDYLGVRAAVVIANPNAPTGIALPLAEIERIVRESPDSIVIVDEAYVDFGGESAVPLTEKYDNLLVCGTFSKSRSMAGARLGFAIGCEALICDLETIRYSTNPYNVNRMTSAAGIAALRDNDYYMANCRVIAETRDRTAAALAALGFEVLPSSANFLFAKSDRIDGERLYLALKARGILVRHFTGARVRAYNRITVGTAEQMNALLSAIGDILKEERS